MMADGLTDLVIRWRADAVVLRRNFDEHAALLNELHALEPEEALKSLHDQLLTRDEAAKVLGVHVDSISRMVRTGRLENVGSKHAPRFRLGDVLRAGSINVGAAQLRQASAPQAATADWHTGTSRAQIARAIANSKEEGDG